jgi:nucleoside-triphosphatase THEP1
MKKAGKMEQRNILVQGYMGAGKTHIVRHIIERFCGERRMAGFFTEKSDTVVRLRAWDNFELMDRGPSEILYDERDRLVRVSAFEGLGVWAVERAMRSAELMVFDELGRFEQGFRRFTGAVHEALDHPSAVIATLKMERNPFLDSLRERHDVKLHTLSPRNRERVHEEITRWISGMVGLR